MAKDASSAGLPDLTEGSIERCRTVATLFYARVNNFAGFCEAIGPGKALSLVKEVRFALTESVSRLGGEIAHRRPDSILAVFSNAPHEARPNHAQRGLHAAILSVHDAVQLAGAWHAGGTGTGPKLSLTVGVHLGPAELSRRRNVANGKVFVTGESVEVVKALEGAASRANWSIAATAGTHLASFGRAEMGSTARVALVGAQPTDVVEITGLRPRPGSTTPAAVYEKLRASLRQN